MAALSALRTRLSVKFNDQGVRGLSAAQQNALINDALERWCANTDELLQDNAYSVTAKQWDYAGPTDLLRMHQAWYAPVAFSPLRIVNFAEFDNAGGRFLTFGAGTPELLMVEGPQNAPRIRVYPPPGASSTTGVLNGAHNSSVTTVTLDSVTGFRSAGWILIDSEKIMYQNIDTTNNQLLLCRRGMGGTTAASHSDDAVVTQLDLFVMYSRRPATLSADGDVPEIAAWNHELLVDMALADALRADRRYEEAREIERNYLRELTDAKRELKKKRAASPSYIIPQSNY